MFGHDDQTGQQDSTLIPDQSIDDAMGTGTPASAVASMAPVVQPASLPVTAAEPEPEVEAVSSNPATTAPVTPTTDTPTDANDLIDIKQQALTQLSPLIGHLEQSPEEKFRTTMMMIQASDNQALIRSAFAAAQNITDEKVRAQALLDIVNEINYFTQQHDS